MADEQINNNRPLKEYWISAIDRVGFAITMPTIKADNFKINPALVQMIQANQFGGDVNDDPYEHVTNFVLTCELFNCSGALDDAVTLRVFPFSLRDKAKSWLYSLPVNTITTWSQMRVKFLARFFPLGRMIRLRKDILSYMQYEGESLFETWERFKDLLRRCPPHGLPVSVQVQTFYNGLEAQLKMMVDAASGGSFMSKSPDDAYELIEEMATNSRNWQTERMTPRQVVEVHELDAITQLTAQVATLTTEVEKLMSTLKLNPPTVCSLCGRPQKST